MASGLTHPAPARQDAPLREQGRTSVSRISQANDARLAERAKRASRDTFHLLESDARTMLADFFSILLARRATVQERGKPRNRKELGQRSGRQLRA